MPGTRSLIASQKVWVRVRIRYACILPASLLILGFFAGCTAKQSVLEEQYRNTSITGKSLVVASVLPVISNPRDVITYLGEEEGDPQQVFLRFFSTHFTQALASASSFEDIRFTVRQPSVPLYWRSPPVASGETLNIALPADSANVLFGSHQPDFVLFVGRLAIWRTAPQAGYQADVGVTGGTSGTLTYQADYAIWDNTAGQVVSYGRAVAESHVPVFSMVRWNWEGCTQLLADKIMSNTPFKK